MRDISSSQMLITEYYKAISNNNEKIKEQVLALLPENMGLEEFKQQTLDKIDEQLMKDIEVQSEMKLDLLNQQKENVKEYIDELKDEYDKAVDRNKLDLAKEIYQRYNEELEQFNNINDKINRAIKQRYDMQFALMDKALNKEKQKQDDIEYQISLANKINPEDYDKQLDLMTENFNSQSNYKNLLEDNRDKLIEQRDELEVGSYEWNIINDKVKEYDEQLEDANLNIIDMTNNINKVKFDSIVNRMTKELDKFNETADNLQDKLSLLENWQPGNTQGINNLTLQLYNNELGRYNTLTSQASELLRQRDAAVGAEAWEMYDQQLKQVNEDIEASILLMSQQQKQLLQNNFNTQLENIEKTLFNGQTQEDAQQALQDRIDEQNKYLEGEEKALEIQKLRNYIRQEELTLTAEQNAILNTQGKLSKESLDRLQKQLEIKQLEQRLDNLKANKSIQQLAKDSQGNWNYTYVADQEAIYETEQELSQKRVDLINWEQDIANQQEQEILDDKSRYLNDLNKILENALNGQYKTQAEFNREINRLNAELGTNYEGTWVNIVSSQLNSGGQLATSFSNIKSSYGTFVSEMTTLSSNLSIVMQNSANAIQSAVASLENAVNRLSEIQQPTIPDSQTIVDATNRWLENGGDINQLINAGSDEEKLRIIGLSSGGYTGDDEGLAYLHKKELILNKMDTKNMLKVVDLVKDILPKFDSVKSWLPKVNMPDFGRMLSGSRVESKTEQHFHISNMTFPNVKDGNDVIETFTKQLPRLSLQYVPK